MSAPTSLMTAGSLGKMPTTSARRLISRLSRSSGFVEAIWAQCSRGKLMYTSTSSREPSIRSARVGKRSRKASATAAHCSRAASAVFWAKIVFSRATTAGRCFGCTRASALRPPQAPISQRAQEGRPERLCFRGARRDPQHLAPAIGVDPDGDYYRNGDDPARVARLQVRRADPQIGPGALDGAAEKGIHPLVNIRAQARDLALGDAGRAHGLDEIVNGPCRDPMNVGLLDHGRKRLLGRAARLEESRGIGALAQLGDGEVDPACPRVPGTIPKAVSVIEPIGAAHARWRARPRARTPTHTLVYPERSVVGITRQPCRHGCDHVGPCREADLIEEPLRA